MRASKQHDDGHLNSELEQLANNIDNVSVLENESTSIFTKKEIQKALHKNHKVKLPKSHQ